MVDWANRWLGGFCKPGIAGLPIRGADYPTNLSLAQALRLPAESAADLCTAQAECQQDSRDQVTTSWSSFVGDHPVVLVQNVQSARRVLLRALGVTPSEPVLLPANATDSLVEMVKQAGARPIWGELDECLALTALCTPRVVWAEPVAGLPLAVNAGGDIVVADYATSVPIGGAEQRVDVALYGLHLSLRADEAGALLVFRDPTLAEQVTRQLQQKEQPDWRRAAHQLERMEALAQQQQTALQQVWLGLQEAAGLALLSLRAASALAHGIAVQIPPESAPSNFFVYARSENTPVAWLPELRPVHHAALTTCPQTTARLERWLLVPVQPYDNEAAIAQAVLGIVKTAEYLGVRWCTNPARAATYAAFLAEKYGPDHDAYRPAFAFSLPTLDASGLSIEHFTATSCRIPIGRAEQ